MAKGKYKKKKSVNKSSARMSTEVGQPGLLTHNGFVNSISEQDLRVPNLYYTIDEMVRASAIKEPLTLSTALQTNSNANGVFEGTGSNLSEALADYGNYIFNNMSDTDPYEFSNNINTHIKYGWSLQELRTERATSGKYKGDLVLKGAYPRDPKSIKAIVMDENRRKVTHFIQNPLQKSDIKLPKNVGNYLGSIASSYGDVRANYAKHPLIDVRRSFHNIYDPSMGNPTGDSPLLSAYKPWREISVMAEYEIIGVARNFGGTPVARVPEELLIRANDPEGRYPEDTADLRRIEASLENAHAGKQSYFLLPSNMDQGKYEWTLELLGVSGTASNFDISDVIKRKTTEIYNCFNAGHLILGQNGNTTSYSAAEHGTNTHATIIERDLSFTASKMRKMLATLLDAAGFVYDRRDLPKFRPSPFDQLGLDELGKFLQRTKTSGSLTESMMRELLKLAKISDEGLDLIDFHLNPTSRAGEGNGTSGNGVTNQDNSTTNMENKSTINTTEIYTADDMGDQVAILDSKGNYITTVDKQ